MRLTFGGCTFDDTARLLTRDDSPVGLSPKAFDLLALLLAGRPAVIGRAQLHDRLWPETFVAGTSLPRLVSELRKALADTAARPRFVRTVRGHGYAFCGQARGEDAASRAESRAARCVGTGARSLSRKATR
jgi:DNA-binding winged helix-turn-helix (wHTH) protein